MVVVVVAVAAVVREAISHSVKVVVVVVPE